MHATAFKRKNNFQSEVCTSKNIYIYININISSFYFLVLLLREGKIEDFYNPKDFFISVFVLLHLSTSLDTSKAEHVL